MSSASPLSGADPHHALASRRLVIAAIVAALLGCSATTYWLWVLRDHRIQFTSRQVRLQTAALAEHASGVFNAVDASLRGTVRDVRDARDGHSDAASVSRGLRQRVSGNPNLHSLSLVGRDGRVLASSSSDPPAMNVPRSQDGDPGLHLAAPPRSLDGEHATLELSRGVSGTGDVDRVVGIVDNAFVGEFFSHVAAAKDARAGLFAPDGTRLGGTLTLHPASGTPDLSTELRELLAASTGSGIERGSLFVSAQQLAGLPMIAVSSRDRSAVFAPWYDYVASALIAMLIGLGALAFIVRRLLGEMRARIEVQAALERTREQARLTSEAAQRTRHLESLGRLSGGIAHDFNNILAVILGFGDLLSRELTPGSTQAQHAEQVMRAGERGKRLVARILSFGRGSTRPQAAIDIEAVVREVLDLRLAMAPPAIHFACLLNAPGAIVIGDAAQLFEALNNLCTNALNAMPHGGDVRIETSTLRAESARPLSHGTLQPNSYVRIAVVDEGPGMPAEVLEHLFEPFFTTRQSQGGNGLGLAMVHGAVTDMGGVIDVVSAPDRGAAFALYLPLGDPALACDSATASHPTPRGRGQVVMVVDDEPALVSLTEEVLADLGYEPAGFRDPILALQVLRSAPERFDALLTDQLMPGVSGIELARALRALRPDAPILLTTGFGGRDLDQRARDAGVSVLLHKPLQRSELAQQLARLFS